jgi:hypothetical protein
MRIEVKRSVSLMLTSLWMTSKGWKCVYPRSKPRNSRIDLWTNTGSTNSSLGTYSVERTKFPAVFFLDAEIFEKLNLETPRAPVSIPAYVNKLLGDSLCIREMASQYFSTVHHWMNILSRKRFYTQQLRPLSQPSAEVTLLLLCMKLIAWVPSTVAEDPKTPLYTAAKGFHSELEIIGCCSIQVLQAGILIAVYELGHSIYPAAYMSIGACARYGTAFGFGENGSKTNESRDWMESEESKRAWWAIMVLDRYVGSGSPPLVQALTTVIVLSLLVTQ